jgi:hypothetical protein
MYFKVNGVEHTYYSCDIYQNRISAAETDLSFGIMLMVDSLVSGRFQLDSLSANCYQIHRGFYTSFGDRLDSIAIVVDSINGSITGHFGFKAAYGIDTVLVTNGVFVTWLGRKYQ